VNVFDLDRALVTDYERFARSFTQIRAPDEPSPETIRIELQRLAKEIFDSAVAFDCPVAKILYKNVAPENVRGGSFLETLNKIMVARRVPREIIDSLFESSHAAPETGAFLR